MVEVASTQLAQEDLDREIERSKHSANPKPFYLVLAWSSYHPEHSGIKLRGFRTKKRGVP
jgi:hypothetical protein